VKWYLSQEDYINDSKRWLKQSEADIRAAEGSKKNKNYEWACFQSQQASEKALKALYFNYSADPWGHSVVKLINDFPEKKIKKEIDKLIDKARELDKLYIPTRYPNGLPELTPSEVYTDEEAGKAIKSSKAIINRVKSILDIGIVRLDNKHASPDKKNSNSSKR
jgi:HEPN domain-containing protein